MLGTNLGSYTILRKLGEGGMGEVYLASHRRLARLAAVKVLLPECSSNADVVNRFFTEARATSLIDHPGIVEVLDCDVLPSGRAYIVMEYLHGEGLAACIRRMGDLRDDFPSVLSIGEQMASALAEAHAKGIVHRDLKPDNVHLLKAGPRGTAPRIKILDFGIAKLAEAGKPSGAKTRTGSLLGTPLYMSPEQCRSSASVDARSDIYALGCILFEMVCGRPPFLGDGFGELIVAHVNEPPPSVAELQPDTPPGLAALIAQMLAKSRDQRPASMRVVGERLQQIASVCPPATVPLKIDEPPEEPIPPQAPTPQSGPRLETAVLTPPGGALGLAGGTQVLRPRTTFGQSTGEVTASRIDPASLRPSRGPGLWIGLGILLAAGGGAGAYLALRPPPIAITPLETATRDPSPRPAGGEAARTPAPTSGSPTSGSDDAPGAAAPSASRETVTIRVSGTPSGTEVTVDGRVGELPIRLVRGGGRHVLQFAAPGYQDLRREVESDRDQDLTVALLREHAPEHRQGSGRSHHHAVSQAPDSASGAVVPPTKKSLNPITDL